MHDMFLSSGVDITLEDCLTLFNFVDEDGSGALRVDEFKLFLKSEEANDSKYSIGNFLVFRKIIRKVRGEGKGSQPLPSDFNWSNTKTKEWDELRETLRIPFNLNVMLEGMSIKNNREKLLD